MDVRIRCMIVSFTIDIVSSRLHKLVSYTSTRSTPDCKVAATELHQHNVELNGVLYVPTVSVFILTVSSSSVSFESSSKMLVSLPLVANMTIQAI
jgi:hypothetical protein